jgi:glycosyltransferase involved in cell wall biosynthesis
MTWLDRLAAFAKRQTLRRIGYIRIMEWRNQVLLAPFVPAVWLRERSEVERLKRSLAPAPSARVAVVVPTYKRQEMARRAVQSILDQTFADFVVVVVDDGAGLPILPEDSRVSSVSLSKNCGIAGVVRNVGIALSNSEYIAFLDDDNTWTPEHLSLCVEALDAGQDLVYTALRRRTPSGRELDVLSAPFDRNELTRESAVDTSAIVIRRTPAVRFSRLPRNRKTVPGEDWEFVFRLSRNARVLHLPVATVDYLIHSESFYTPWPDTMTR